MNNIIVKDMLKIAMEQSAIDSNCNSDDFISSENKIVISRKNKLARVYLELPFLCDFTSYGNNIVASVSEEYAEIARAYITKFQVEHCFETPNLHWFISKIQTMGSDVCFMAEYFLPSSDDFPIIPCKFKTKLLDTADFDELYLPQWSNALCKSKKHLYRLGVGAYFNGTLIGLAACSADCETMWQIGIDVLPEHRKQGIAAALTNLLAHEIIKRNKVPFYCCAWSNIKSVRTALKSGFLPSWVQLTVKSKSFIDELNK